MLSYNKQLILISARTQLRNICTSDTVIRLFVDEGKIMLYSDLKLILFTALLILCKAQETFQRERIHEAVTFTSMTHVDSSKQCINEYFFWHLLLGSNVGSYEMLYSFSVFFNLLRWWRAKSFLKISEKKCLTKILKLKHCNKLFVHRDNLLLQNVAYLTLFTQGS